MELIRVKNLTLGYDNRPIIKNVSFDIEDGDFIIIVGPNGSGKSTLVKGILGLINPIKGSIEFKTIKKSFIGYMPQITKVDSNFPASVYEIILSGCLNKLGINPFYKKEHKEKVNEVIKLLKLENIKNRNFCDLSGGQRQKVLLARSLCATSKLLIMDEPSNNLDYKSKIDLYNIASKLNKEKGITIIMVTHDLDHENLIGNKVLSLGEKEFFFGTADSYRGLKHDK